MIYNTHKKYRSVLPLGKQALAITLPVSWARRHGLRRGDQVKVTEQGDALLIEAI
jgi:phosphate uptake regulator